MLLRSIFTLITIITIRCFLSAQQIVLSGYVVDDIGEAAIGANITVLNTQHSVLCNQYGYFAIRLNPGRYCMSFSYLGAQKDTICFDLVRDTSISHSMQTIQLNSVDITDQKMYERTQMSVFELPLHLLKKIPSLGGEQDIIKGLSFTPGVTNGVEGSSGLFVRGGTPDQNLILLDNAVVYNPNHLFGFLSVFNADAVKKVVLLKGGFPAMYGGRLSSVLDITMKEGNRKKMTGTCGVGLISSRLLIEGPIGKQKKGSFMVGGRSAYLGLLLFPLRLAYTSGKASDYTGYNMYDINIKCNYDISKHKKVFASFYTGHDRLNVWSKLYPGETKTNLDWGNITGTLRYNQEISPRIFYKSMVIVSNFNNQFKINTAQKDQDVTRSEFTNGSGLRQYAFKNDFDFYQSAQHIIHGGIDMSSYQFMPRKIKYMFENQGDTLFKGSNDLRFAEELSTYLEDEWAMSPKASFRFGIRWNAFRVEKTTYHSVQPRVALQYSFRKNMSIKASWGLANQNIHLLTSNNIGLQNDIWIPTTTAIKPQKGAQTAVGYSAFLSALNTEINIEAYYKKLNNQIEYKEGVNTFANINPNWERDIATDGIGHAYGIEVGAVKQSGKFTGMFAYTWSRSVRKFSAINDGKTFDFKYDLPHNLNMTGAYTLNKHWDFSMTYAFHSGQPFSFPVTAFSTIPGGNNENIAIFYYDKRNNVRLPNYHRVDIGANRNITTRKKRTAVLGFSVFNALNRKNPLYAQIENKSVFNYQTNQYEFKPALSVKSFLPILPSVSYSIQF